MSLIFIFFIAIFVGLYSGIKAYSYMTSGLAYKDIFTEKRFILMWVIVTTLLSALLCPIVMVYWYHRFTRHYDTHEPYSPFKVVPREK